MLSGVRRHWTYRPAVAFVASTVGTVVGDHGTILRTPDGGSSWIRQDSGSDLPLSGVSFVDGEHGTAVGSNLTNTSGVLRAIAFASQSTAVAVGANGALRTTDGGATWQTVSFERLCGVSFLNENIGGVVGFPNLILRTEDSGGTWAHQSSLTNDLQAVWMIDANDGLGGSARHPLCSHERRNELG